MGKTIAEKILSAHADKDLSAGEMAICKIDFCFGQDGTSGLIIDVLQRMGRQKVFDRDKFAMVIDHSAPSPNQGVSSIHKKMRDFARKAGVEVYDIGRGVCHQVIPESGRVVPGDLVIGADSHTCTYGALNVLSTGMGSTDLAIAVASGTNWFKCPESVKIILNGKLPVGVYAKDIILYLIGELTADGATYKSIEFEGPVIENLSVESRFTISNMAVEMGAKCGLMQADDKVIKWVKAHSEKKPHAVSPAPDAIYSEVKEYDLSDLSPQVARPHQVDNVVDITQVAGTRIDQAYLGTCTNGRLEDLRIAAGILEGKEISPEVRLIVAPASRQIFLDAIGEGIVQTFIKSGAAVVTPGCGPCVGTHNGVPADGEVVISTANRNFKGRMGNPNAFIYLASPATVAASAVKGVITDPRKFIDK